MSEENQSGKFLFPIEWQIPDDFLARYATNILVQSGENEYFVSFFETKPPFLLGTPEQISEQANSLKAVKAHCVAQVIIPEEKMPGFIEALQNSMKKHLEMKEEVTE